jgi:hypothetical protein
MQFHLEPEERKLLADILLEQEVGKYNELLNKVLDCHLRFDVDELEQTATLIADKKRRLKDEIARQPVADLKSEVQQQLVLLQLEERATRPV